MNENNTTEHRLSTVEAQQSNLGELFEREIRALHGEIQLLHDAISKLRSIYVDAAKTDWRGIWGGVAVALTIVGMIGLGYVRDLNRMEHWQESGLLAFIDHAKDGHPWRIEDKIEVNTSSLSDLKAENAKSHEFLLDQFRHELGLYDNAQNIMHEGLGRRISVIEEMEMKEHGFK